MRILRYGDSGPLVALLQTALIRAGRSPGAPDGIFGYRTQNAVITFQRGAGLTADGIVGPRTHRALMPYYLGYLTHTVKSGDSLYRIAMMYGTSLRAVETANPGLDPLNLRVNSTVIVPLSFDVVPTNIPLGSTAISYCIRGLAARYPFLNVGEAGHSVMGRPLLYITMGQGENRVLYNASHHANEWITTTVLLKFTEDYARAYMTGGQIYRLDAREVFSASTLGVVPCVNPDGVDLVTGELDSGAYFQTARTLAQNYPSIPFPDGWKANIRGVDLNLQYPAGWEQAREIKFSQGFTSPGPRDYVGAEPLIAPESRAMYTLTQDYDPALTLSYHTQGQVIYWKYLDLEPPGALAIAERFAITSGYLVEDAPYASGFAGYKDWFIQDYFRPGYTIEAGLGENPLPIRQFDKIYANNLGILALGAVLTSAGSLI
jgi:g-D-glutamyl-meso-diaminopimelate peptidase